MPEILKNKWVLYGGGAVAAIGAFLLLSGSGDSAAEPTGEFSATSFGTQFPNVVFGSGVTAGSQSSTTTETNASSTGFDATAALLELENLKVEKDFSLQTLLANNTQAIGLVKAQNQFDVDQRTLDVAKSQSAFQALTRLGGDIVKRTKLKRGGTGAFDIGGEQFNFNIARA